MKAHTLLGKKKKKERSWKRWRNPKLVGEFKNPVIGLQKGGILPLFSNSEDGIILADRLPVFKEFNLKIPSFVFVNWETLTFQGPWHTPWEMSPILYIPPSQERERLQTFQQITDGTLLSREEEEKLVKELDL